LPIYSRSPDRRGLTFWIERIGPSDDADFRNKLETIMTLAIQTLDVAVADGYAALGVRLGAKRVADTGKVALGGRAPSLPAVSVRQPSTADKGKVVIGGRSPSL
jgi:hypothetical protein